MSSQKYWNKIYRYVAGAVFGLVIIGVILAFLPKVTQFSSYQKTRNELEEDIRNKEKSIKELRIKQERFGSDKYFVQQIAHEIGFAHEDETIYQFNDKTLSNAPTIEPRKATP